MIQWLIWACLLFAQNYSFTYVSRSRNSADVKRHMLAASLSNIVWFFNQLITVGKLLDLITGKHGWMLAAFTGIFYTVFTMLGSYISHKVCLRTERGKAAVGASAQYAQITKEEWEEVKKCLSIPVST